MNHHELRILVIGAVAMCAACGRTDVPPVHRLASGVDSTAAADPERAVRQTVSRFGARMQSVALQAPDSIAASRLQEAYGTLVTPDLLSDWMSRPASAPGRHLSRPSPDHIEVRSLQPASADEYLVTGALIYQAGSVGSSKGPPAAAPVRLHVRRGSDGTWRISMFEGATTSVGS